MYTKKEFPAKTTFQDYKPYPDGSDMLAGDYPDLPLVPEAHRSSFYEWDYPEYKR